jgi:aminoglycoside 6'-N-acetyltransferase I
MDIRRLRPLDEGEWIRLKTAVDPDSDPDELREYLPAYLEGGDPRVLSLVIARNDTTLGGVFELILRAHAEGSFSSPVACVNDWYIDEDLRGQGWGRKLLDEACDWARHHGCSEIASTCLVDNETAVEVHEHLGFEEVDRLVHFVRLLPAEG